MNALKAARRFIESHPEDPGAKVLAGLVVALESDQMFKVTDIYSLQLKQFDLAVEIIKEWRIDRHYASKVKLIDMANQVKTLSPTEGGDPA